MSLFAPEEIKAAYAQTAVGYSSSARLTSSSARRRNWRTFGKSWSRAKAASMRARSSTDATRGRRPFPMCSPVACQRRSS